MLLSSSMNSPYLFSGLLKCSECGANITVLWGKGRNKTSAAYGCPMNFNRGETVCKNTVRIRKDELEATLLAGLQEKVMREEVIDYVLERFEAGLLKELDNIGGELERMHARKAKLESELSNLANAVAGGQHSPTIMGAITDREREIAAITESIVSANSDSIKSKIARMREMAGGTDERAGASRR